MTIELTADEIRLLDTLIGSGANDLQVIDAIASHRADTFNAGTARSDLQSIRGKVRLALYRSGQ